MSKMGDVSKVVIDSSVVMKIIKHSKVSSNKLATGQLHGVYFYNDNVLEISNSYPIPNKESNDTSNDVDNYDNNMMNKLDTLNLDNNKVGWYQVSYSNDHLYYASFETHLEYQKSHPFAVFLVFDVLESEKGGKSPFKVYRIHENFVELLKSKDIPAEKVKKLNVKYDKFFVEIPHEIYYSPLTKAFFSEQSIQTKSSGKKQMNFFVDFLKKNTNGLIDSLEDLENLEGKINEEFLKPIPKNSKKIEKKSYESESLMDYIITLKRLNNFGEETKNVGDLLTESSILIKEIQKVVS